MDGFDNEEGVLSLDTRELLAKSRLRRGGVRTDSRLGAPRLMFARDVRRTDIRKPLDARGRDDSESDSDSESETKKQAAPRPTADRAKQVGAQLPAQSSSRVAAVTTGRREKLIPTPVVATSTLKPTPPPGVQDRFDVVGKPPAPPSPTSRAPVASSPAPVPSLAPDAKAQQPLPPTRSSQMPAAQQTGFRFPDVEAARQRDGGEKDLRTGRFSPGAEAGIVVDTLAFIILVDIAVFCFRRRKARSRTSSERKFTRPISSPPSQNLRIQLPEQAPEGESLAESMPADEPEPLQTGDPNQSQAARPMNWL